ncbi:hypothetical protein DAEQUDRAFT_758627 [Daedalea quercina L-15889]|uniref:Alpha/beta-hydrolase n=1 Tax=Daedalea quercina L-15889 TaxID=1314783 RepID=A0A165N7R8_9APHY|nr:hypothetical protein DAEQUDRAFT_758627 [Daedalea quercina L-15889]
MHLEDTSKLLVIPASESAIIRDRDSGEVIAVVIRGFCEDEEILGDINSDLTTDCAIKRSVRKEDPGKLVLAGYSAGSRSSPSWDWARNIESRKHSPDFVHSHDMAISSAFALFNQKMHALLPAELAGDFDHFFDSNQFPRMDVRGAMATGDEGYGEYYVKKGNSTIVFHHEKLAPPVGVVGANYSRAIHSEKQPHKFAYSWTTERAVKTGGSFYIASYRIKIEQAANTFTAWQPEHLHGTSLLGYGPHNGIPPFAQ